MLMVSSTGLKESFQQVARDIGHRVVTQSVDDLFFPHPPL